eukprot:COSAG06_NODE_4764_length_3973_cov_2.013677_2_plen_111_part_00
MNSRLRRPGTVGLIGQRSVQAHSTESFSLRWAVASPNQPLPKDSQWHMSTLRCPSMLHIAISYAPVSEAGTCSQQQQQQQQQQQSGETEGQQRAHSYRKGLELWRTMPST